MNGQLKDGRKRVLVVGAGAAGMSCAAHLANHPEKFDVTLVDPNANCGGQAFSIDIDKNKYGASWLNQGVQGGSYIFHHTMTMFARQGYTANPVELQVSFGKDESFWTNVFPTKLLADHQKEIAKLVWVLKLVRWFELVFALLPLKYLFKLFWFSEFFANTVAMPMIALFLGTGNYTPDVPTIILERLCTSPTYGLWYHPKKHTVVDNLPPMVVFPNFTDFYNTWKEDLIRKGVHVRLLTEVTEVVERSSRGVVVKTKPKEGNTDAESKESIEEYDEIVLCVLADAAKKLLGKTAGLRERQILGTCKFSDDITVTHNDTEYMKKHYTNFFDENQAVSELSGIDQSSRIEHGKKAFQPMYLIKTYPNDRSKLEMCFDCTNYQAQFPEKVPFESHVFQTIFLNKDRDRKHWDLDEIREDKIIQKNWWHQLCHSWTHYAFVVPWLWTIQGFKHTRFAASWTLVNAHEVACISGTSAAVSLGAEYPEDLERDKFSFLCFRLYYLFMYRSWYRRKATKKSKEGKGADWASGLYGAMYQGPGVAQQERSMWREDREAGKSTGNDLQD